MCEDECTTALRESALKSLNKQTPTHLFIWPHFVCNYSLGTPTWQPSRRSCHVCESEGIPRVYRILNHNSIHPWEFAIAILYSEYSLVFHGCND